MRPDLVSNGRFLASRREEIIEGLYEQVKALETRYRKLYEGSPEMYRTIDIDGFIVDCNQAYVDNLGYSTKSDVIGHSVFEHTAPDSLAAMRESFKEWQEVGQVRNKEVRLRKNDGAEFPALINATSLYDDAGHLVGSNTVITDISAVYQSRERLKQANDALKKAQQIRDDFLRVAAHDLRNPIQPILIAADLAKTNPDRRDAAIEIIVKEARRLKQLANDLLDLSRIEGGVAHYEIADVPAAEIVGELAEEARRSVADVKVNIISVVPADGIFLEVDRSKILQALLNIVYNAIKFTREGSITIQGSMISQGRFEFTISDSGPGIPAEIMPNLFERFATKSPEKGPVRNEGTGLGLFICKSIVESHGGTVAASNNGSLRGATFVVTLPAKVR